jgi:release factor glutamine methyltransferase
MKNSKTIFHEVIDTIDLQENPEEIKSIVYFLLTRIFDITKTDILVGRMVPFSEATAHALQKAVKRINQGEPIQYILGEEHFFGRKFHVNPSVLIPRPETEGLIRVVLNYRNLLLKKQYKTTPFRILDIGTGSGCIPVTLFKEIPLEKQIYATDVSNAALSVAVNNAEINHAEITFIEHDILKEKLPLTGLDVIVSNPPYVTEKERNQMAVNVLGYEPHEALFVPDDDPLVFYRQIAMQAQDVLNPNGLLAVEINQKYSEEVSGLFINCGFSEVQVEMDIAGRPRIVHGLK